METPVIIAIITVISNLITALISARYGKRQATAAVRKTIAEAQKIEVATDAEIIGQYRILLEDLNRNWVAMKERVTRQEKELALLRQEKADLVAALDEEREKRRALEERVESQNGELGELRAENRRLRAQIEGVERRANGKS